MTSNSMLSYTSVMDLQFLLFFLGLNNIIIVVTPRIWTGKLCVLFVCNHVLVCL